MAAQRISKVMESPDGSFVFAVKDDVDGYRVVCSGCPELQGAKAYRSEAGAVLAASYHADLDPVEKHVPTTDSPRPPWR